ncbi:MAG: glycosyltransferase family 4 protein, partial [Actinomycetota bacterium]
MNVALYASQLVPEGPTGVHRYVSELVPALFERHRERYRLLSGAEEAEAAWVPSGMPLKRLPGPRRVLHLAWYLARRPRIERFVGRIDLLHVLYPSFPIPTRAPFVYTIHDVQHIEDPGAYRRREVVLAKGALRDAAHAAARIVVVSSVVAQEVSARLGVDPARIAVVHHGVAARFRAEHAFTDVDTACARFGVERGRYLIYVGKVETRKNLSMLLHAIAARGPGARLVVAGPPGVGADMIGTEIEGLGLASDVIMTGHIDADLALLMAGALALVHPSRYERFGLPPLEAMALGIPVLASRAGAIPEVLGFAAE